ncbi:MAG: RnfABCDGE type electron transport complex subunit D [ANME-2 cluster archaeon]|nr:RnfABCDGE type electron transport complex subunit D [ANME-2 cluster archaeon]
MKLAVSHPPHVKNKDTIASINFSKIAVLVPVSLISVYVFGVYALAIILISVLAAVITEAAIQKFQNQELTIKNGDTVLIGLILALLLPPTVPLWIPVIGVFFAVALVKHAFGGLGSTLFNPAIAGLVFLNMSWSGLLASESVPHITQYSDFILELGAGRLVEVSPIALIGVLYLIHKKNIEWRIPLSFLLTTIVLAVVLGEDLSYVFTGMLLLSVFFLATDSTTSPITKDGRIVYGIMCGALTIMYGYFSYNYGLGAVYTVFFANAVSPFIEKNTYPKPVDEVMA